MIISRLRPALRGKGFSRGEVVCMCVGTTGEFEALVQCLVSLSLSPTDCLPPLLPASPAYAYQCSGPPRSLLSARQVYEMRALMGRGTRGGGAKPGSRRFGAKSREGRQCLQVRAQWRETHVPEA